MTKPSSIKFLGKTYRIEYVDEIVLEHDENDSTSITKEEEASIVDLHLFGVTLNAKKLIQVRSDLDSEESADTTLHEILHMVDFLLDLELTERQIKVVASSVIALLQANQDLREFIHEHTTT